MERNSSLVISYIEAHQRNYLIGQYGLDFESKLESLIPTDESLSEFLEKDLELTVKDDGDRYEMEALLKNELLEETPNPTKYESPVHRRLLFGAEKLFMSLMGNQSRESFPYCATILSGDVDAEITYYEDLDRPIIFFGGDLFIANLLFCKLYVLHLNEEKKDRETPTSKDNINPVLLPAVYFFNRYFSHVTKVAPQYNLKSDTQKSFLALLLESILLFIFSHEVGHAVLKHDLKNETNANSWNEEHEADLYAINRIIALYRSKNSGNPFSLIGPIIFLKYRFFLEKFRPEIGKVVSHPPTLDRLQNYYIHLKNLTNDDEQEAINEVLELENTISRQLTEMFNEFHLKSKSHMIYFAYGSNMLTAWLEKRVGKIEVLGVGILKEHSLRFDKESTDGSLKADAFNTREHDDVVVGVLFKIDINRKADLDRAEGLGKGYGLKEVEIVQGENLIPAYTYFADTPDLSGNNLPYDWYVELIIAGAREHGLPEEYINKLTKQVSKTDPDSERSARRKKIASRKSNK